MKLRKLPVTKYSTRSAHVVYGRKITLNSESADSLQEVIQEVDSEFDNTDSE